MANELPRVIAVQWKAAQRENTPVEWAYVAGMIAMEISRDPITTLMEFHNIAMRNANPEQQKGVQS